jgi:ribulose 1,5-bisphosphate carboxylase large subunit-like protein
VDHAKIGSSIKIDGIKFPYRPVAFSLGRGVSGGIHGHPKGTRSGATATIQAIEAWKDGVPLGEKAKSAPELAQALDKWGFYHPK